MRLKPAEYLANLASDGELLARAAESDLSAPVPSCPGWDVAELVRHIGGVHRQKAEVVRRADPSAGNVPAPVELDEPADLLVWYRTGLDDLLRVLDADPEQPAYSWSGDHRVAFWQRRMAQETLMHRWDAENAVAARTPVDQVLALDGVDELLRVFAPATDYPFEGSSGSVGIRATDTSNAWTVHLHHHGAMSVDDGGDGGDALVEAVATDLLLGLWRRIPQQRMSITGDRNLATAFLGWIDET